MRFGTFHLIGAPEMQPGEQRVGETIDQIVLADQLGMHKAWVAEHHFSNYGYATNPLLIIAKAAGLAPRIRFGQAIIVTPFWHPLRLAEDIALTDILTGGRLDVGVGRGYQKMEFDGLGLRIEDSRATFVERRQAAGDPDPSPPVAVQRFVFVSDTEEEARAAMWQTRWLRRLANHLRNDVARIVAGRNEPFAPESEPTDEEMWDRVVYGSPERCIAQIRRDVEMGFTDFIGWFDVGGLPAATVEKSMRRFAAEVMPAFAEVGAAR
jgi:alkanesulfonate monooxygenase SsuD/methylene tetrahydromethanopterin reductase-like flavin-dependent oxidoreductase (luciferase family)